MNYILVNVVGFFSILLLYVLLMTVLQNLFSLLCSGTGMQATRKLASGTMFISAGSAAAFSIYTSSFALDKFGYHLSIIPIILWSVLQIAGIANSVFNHREDVMEEMVVVVGDAEIGAMRAKYIGQFYGTLLGITLGIVAHYI